VYNSKYLHTHCNALQRIATHCHALHHTNLGTQTRISTPALQRTAMHCNAHTWGPRYEYLHTHCKALQRTATHCNTLQHTAIHRTTLQCTHLGTQLRVSTTGPLYVFNAPCHSYVWHDSFKRHMTHPRVQLDSCICAVFMPSLLPVIHMCGMTHSTTHDSFKRRMTHSKDT